MDVRVILILLSLVLPLPAICAEHAEVYSIRSPESDNDHRYNYDRDVLKLALEKTRAQYGEYELVPTKSMNFPRAVATAEANLYQNFFIKHTYQQDLNDRQLDYVPFPVDLGIVGYRVCFVSETIKPRIEQATSINEIQRFTHGQGAGWSDVKILRHHGFQVTEVANYESLFSMVAINRFDLFCRGANELWDEYRTHQHIEKLSYDTTMSIAYPLPRFFYTHQSNKQAIKRVTDGLIAAYQDGSLLKLWMEHYGPSIDFVRLDKRRIYWIENPLLEGLSDDYRRYFYDPLKQTNGNHSK